MAEENTLGLDALGDDLSINLDGDLIEGLPTPPAEPSVGSDVDDKEKNLEIRF